jgi:beta-lactamase superfamily II metal-dependent hydrolase
MLLRIFDVAHGFCALVIADTGNIMLIDCGDNDETGFYPADYLIKSGFRGIERFFVLNLDEDHLSGLPRLRQMRDRIPVRILHKNFSITDVQLRDLKEQSASLGPGMRALLAMSGNYNQTVTSPPDFGLLSYEVFYNNYPTFEDTNNLSLVLFLDYPGLSIVFPGDLEVAGWEALLENISFRQRLSRVNVFVASHHGRESGYCDAVFAHCAPEIVVISDEEIRFDTQESVDYAVHTKGINWTTGGVRRVLTTRSDGMIWFEADALGKTWVKVSK